MTKNATCQGKAGRTGKTGSLHDEGQIVLRAPELGVRAGGNGENEVAAALEDVCADGGDAGGDDKGGRRIAEGLVPDGGQAVGQNDVRQFDAVLEGCIPDGEEAIGQNDAWEVGGNR